jgi:hypothetical protein
MGEGITAFDKEVNIPKPFHQKIDADHVSRIYDAK